MATSLGFWLAVIGIVYPLFLHARLFLFFPPPWWFAECWILMGFVLPPFMATVLLFARLSGVKVTLAAVLTFPSWICLVNWLYLWVLGEVAAGC